MSVHVLTSPLLRREGFLHGFSTRRGGVSPAPFATLNLGFPSALETHSSEHAMEGDLGELRANEPARIEENITRLLDACGMAERLPTRVRQVHGAECFERNRNTCPGLVEADAVLSGDPSEAILVRTADCVPILIASPRTGRVAAVHAGWRGLAAGVIAETVERLDPSPDTRDELIASIGPSIGVDVYEVGLEVAARFADVGLGECVRSMPAGAKPHLDCHAAARSLLVRAGLRADRVDGDPLCTFANERDFFSARRDGPISGRMAAVIGARVSRPASPRRA